MIHSIPEKDNGMSVWRTEYTIGWRYGKIEQWGSGFRWSLLSDEPEQVVISGFAPTFDDAKREFAASVRELFE